jgi:WD40 repeat protein
MVQMKNAFCVLKNNQLSFWVLTVLCVAVVVIFPIWREYVRNVEAAVDHLPQQIATLDVKGPINSVAFDHTGERLAVLSNYGGRITLYSTANWSLEKEADRFGGGYSNNSLALLGNKHVLVSTPIGDYSGDPRWANTPLVDPRYTRVDNFALVEWDPFASKAIKYFPSTTAAAKSAEVHNADTFAISPDGSVLVAINTDHVLIFNAVTAALISTYKTDDGTIASVAVIGNTLAIGTLDGHVILYDIAKGRAIREFQAYEDEYSVSSIAFSPDGVFLVTGKHKTTDGHRVNGEWVKRKHSLVEGDIWALDGSRKSSLMAESGILEGDDAPEVSSLAWSPDGRLIAIGDERGFSLWRVKKGTNSLAWDRHMGSGSFSVAFSAQGALAVANDSKVLIFK